MPANFKDILFITAALSTIISAAILAIALYYIIASLREVRHIAKTIRKKIDTLCSFTNDVKDKTATAVETAATISKAAIEVIEYIKERKK